MSVTYVPSDAFPTVSGATVGYGVLGETFDIAAALIAGSGSFAVDDSNVAGAVLRDALDEHPAVERSGIAGGIVVILEPVVDLQVRGVGIAGQVPVSQGDGTAEWDTPAATALSGLAANVPAIGTVPPGSLYFATDTGRLYRAGNVFWVLVADLAGTELGYSEITASQTGISTEVDLTGGSLTFTAGSRPIMLHAFSTGFQQLTAAAIPQLKITTAANVQVALQGAGTTAINAFTAPVNMFVRATGLVAGTSYTYKLRALTSAGSCTHAASASQRAFLRAYQV